MENVTDPKPQPNDELYLEILRRMSPADRLRKAFELTELSRKLLRAGLENQFPELSPEEIQALYVKRLLAIAGYERPS